MQTKWPVWNYQVVFLRFGQGAVYIQAAEYDLVKSLVA